MRIIRSNAKLAGRPVGGAVVTVGVFDGVHLGHAEVIRRLAETKRAEGAESSILITFDRHPLAVTNPARVPPQLTTLEEKLWILGGLEVDIVLVEPFSAETAATGYGTYLADHLKGELGMRHLVVGYDFHLGHGREGTQERLVEAGRSGSFGVTIVPPVVLAGSVVSSTRIRRDVAERRLEHAARSLGRPFFFEAEVVPGDGVGRTLGFPTANAVVADPAKLLPPEGVYAVLVDALGRRQGGMMNVGRAPTLRADGSRRIEVHLFDFSENLYGERIRVHCLSFLREERVFATPAELKAQLMQDRLTVYGILEKKH